MFIYSVSINQVNVWSLCGILLDTQLHVRDVYGNGHVPPYDVMLLSIHQTTKLQKITPALNGPGSASQRIILVVAQSTYIDSLCSDQ